MKVFLYKRIMPIILSISIAAITFFAYYVPVYAVDFMPTDIVAAIEYGIENNDWEPFYRFLYETSDGLMYLFSQMGAITTKDFIKWVDNNEKLASLANTVPARKEGDNIVFTKELMAQLKALLDEYMKTEQSKEENGGFYLLPTTKYIDVPANLFSSSFQYQTFRNIVIEKGVLAVSIDSNNMYFFDPYNDIDQHIELFGIASDLNRYKNNPVMPVEIRFYDMNEWKNCWYTFKAFPEKNKVYTSITEAQDYYGSSNVPITTNEAYINFDVENHGSYGYTNFILYSSTGEKIRVFVSENAAKNYSVGNRKVFVTNNYYDYEPEDLTVSIDDLQKSVDDLQKIIDELLKRITDRTSEKEIMELLRLILEELRKNPGGGGSSSGGDVTVNVDLNTTNSWLSKIYDKVSQIFDKISSSAGQSMSEVVETIENLEKMLKKYLSVITGDLDDIKGQLEEMSEQEFTEKTGDFLDDTLADFSEIGEKAKGKFPFSIPNDIRLLITKMTVSPPVDPDQGTYSMQTDSYAAAYESNGLVSVMDEGGGDVPVLSETGAPIFYLPFVIASAGIEQYVVIDLSGFESISKFCRGLMTIWFILCLYNLTFKVMGLWGDLVD